MEPSPPKDSAEAIARLRDFGYAFNTAGELRKIDEATGEAGEDPFVFDISDGDLKTNQKHYDQLADQIPEIIYALLEQNGLKRTYIPFKAKPERASFVFTQPAQLAQSEKLLVLIHGSGYVRAGQWARSLIINNSLDHGSQLPYIQRAQKLGYDILVTNTNDNDRIINGKRYPIEGVKTPIDSAEYVWEHLVVPSKPKSVAIVAHSYGGAITIELTRHFLHFFKEKVFAIALTDSAHGALPTSSKDYLQDVARNWGSSREPLDAKLPTCCGIERVSAGHPKHEWSSWAAMESVFKYIEEKHATHEQDRQARLSSV